MINLVSNERIYGLHESLVASGYPMHSSPINEENFDKKIKDLRENYSDNKDIKRAKNLSKTKIGSGHDNFLNGIVVQFDLAFTIKAWTEAQRYHFLDFVSSMSSIHKLKQMNFNECFNEYVTDRTKNEMWYLQELYVKNPTKENELKLLYNCPVGLKLTARMTTNYRQLKTIYHQRKNHKLPEWREFCKWIETLPCAEFIINKK